MTVKPEEARAFRRGFFIIFFLAILCSFAFSETAYWLRGNDFTNLIEGYRANFLTSTSPNASSSESVFSAGEGGVIGRWYSAAFASAVQLYRGVTFWSNGLEAPSAEISWELYDFDPKSLESRFLAKGEGVQEGESSAVLPQPVTIASGHRLKFVLYADGKGAKITLDGSSVTSKSEWVSPDGGKFSALGVKSTALIAITQCGESEIACTSNASCADSNPYTEDTCLNAGTCQASCTHAQCEPGCVYNSDCSDENPLTLDVCENIGTCTSYCANTICRTACSNDAACNDGNDKTREKCEYAGTCYSYCMNTELVNTTISETGCRVIECTGKSCVEKEKDNCCGNGLCEQGETCNEDCSGVSMIVVSPGQQDYFVSGDSMNLIIQTEKGATVTATGFFGNETLLDDGRNNDSKAGDGIFGKSIPVSAENAGTQMIAVESSIPKRQSIFLYAKIIPRLDVRLSAEQTEIVPGDSIVVTGNVSRKGMPVQGTVLIEGFSNPDSGTSQKSAFSGGSAQSDSFGNFFYRQQTSQSLGFGALSVKASVSDALGNKGEASAQLNVITPE
ncbi:MAG: hypothetical protein AABW99_03620, partial [archaeon]